MDIFFYYFFYRHTKFILNMVAYDLSLLENNGAINTRRTWLLGLLIVKSPTYVLHYTKPEFAPPIVTSDLPPIDCGGDVSNGTNMYWYGSSNN